MPFCFCFLPVSNLFMFSVAHFWYLCLQGLGINQPACANEPWVSETRDKPNAVKDANETAITVQAIAFQSVLKGLPWLIFSAVKKIYSTCFEFVLQRLLLLQFTGISECKRGHKTHGIDGMVESFDNDQWTSFLCGQSRGVSHSWHMKRSVFRW